MLTEEAKNEIIEAIRTAQRDWTGADWDVDPQLSELIHALLLAQIGVDRGGTAQLLDETRAHQRDGSHKAQQFAARYNAAVKAAERAWMDFDPSDLEISHEAFAKGCKQGEPASAREIFEALERQIHNDALKKAKQVADLHNAITELESIYSEQEYEVESDANTASEHGQSAIEALQSDDYDDAESELTNAARLERYYGDAPTWDRPLRMLAHAIREAEQNSDDD